MTRRRIPEKGTLFSQPAKERRNMLHAFVGLEVEVEVDFNRDGQNVKLETGRLLAVAVPNLGGIADQIVLAPESSRHFAACFSLATVRSVTVL